MRCELNFLVTHKRRRGKVPFFFLLLMKYEISTKTFPVTHSDLLIFFFFFSFHYAFFRMKFRILKFFTASTLSFCTKTDDQSMKLKLAGLAKISRFELQQKNGATKSFLTQRNKENRICPLPPKLSSTRQMFSAIIPEIEAGRERFNVKMTFWESF